MSVGYARVAIGRLFWLRWRLRIWIALAIGLGAGVGQLPLFGVLGFELALAVALFAAVMGTDLGSALAREIQRLGPSGSPPVGGAGRALVRGTVASSVVAVGVVLIPAVFAAIRGIWTPTCDWWFGVVAYLVMPIATAALGAALGHALGVLAGPRRFLGAALAQLPVIVVAAAAFYRFYSEPPVFTYNAILGYFPGNMYDENVKLGAALAWSRLEQLAWVVAIVALVATRLDGSSYRVRLRALASPALHPTGETDAPGRAASRWASRRLGALAIAVVAAAGAGTLRLQSGRLGYAVDAEDITDVLGGRYETAHFVIHYAKTPEIEAEIQLIAKDHELRFAQVVAQIGIAPVRKIRSFYFSNRNQKYALFGAKDVEMAKPWLHDIYLDHRSFPHGSLRHEIAHAVAGEFGDPIFGVAARRVLGVPALMSPGLIEGLAVALDWPAGYDRPNPHESVRAMQAMGKLPPLRTLFGMQFFSVSSARGYTTAGSFLRFLLDRHGPAKLRAVYASGGHFTEAYGVPLEALEAEWKAMLSTIILPKATVDASAERFRGTSVFARPCPHAVAARREHAFASYGDGDRPRAVKLMRSVCQDAPEEPRHLLELGDLLVDGGGPDRGEAEAIWTRVATDAEGVTSTLRAQAYERLARLFGARGDLDGVRKLVTTAVTLPLEMNERRTLDGMVFALAHQGPAGLALRQYFFPAGIGFSPLQHALVAVLAEPRLGLAHYLVGLQRANAGEWSAAAVELDLALANGLPGVAFTKNAARRLAVAAYRIGDRNRLAVAITVLSSSAMTSGDHQLAKDWLDRISHDATDTLYPTAVGPAKSPTPPGPSGSTSR